MRGGLIGGKGRIPIGTVTVTVGDGQGQRAQSRQLIRILWGPPLCISGVFPPSPAQPSPARELRNARQSVATVAGLSTIAAQLGSEASSGEEVRVIMQIGRGV
jgi:hypothetical protein